MVTFTTSPPMPQAPIKKAIAIAMTRRKKVEIFIIKNPLP
jgi:hypothetical protein